VILGGCVKIFSRPVVVIAIGVSLIAVVAAIAVPMWQAGTVRPRESRGTGASVLPGATTARAPAAREPVTVSVVIQTVSAPDGVAFTGEQVEVRIVGVEADNFDAQQWPLEQVSLDFGDGTSLQADGHCGAGSTLLASHTYQSSGLFDITVSAARFCDPAARPLLSETTSDMRVLPSAPASAWSWPRCSQDQVQISASVGHVQLVAWAMHFTVRNVSASDCHLYGYPGLQFVCPDGSLLRPGTVLRDPDPLGSSLPPHLVALAPGDVASFALGYAIGGPPPSAGCRGPVDQAEVFLPGSAAYSLIPITGDTEDAGIADTGEFIISTVVPGATPWT
jgi:hypothetical protein